MPATQVPVQHAVAERTRRLLTACSNARTAEDYARRLLSALTGEIPSEHAIWLDFTTTGTDVVAETSGCHSIRGPLCLLCERAPIFSNHLDPELGIASIVAAPLLFRGAVAGVLALANAAGSYTPADLEVLTETGRAALAHYESLVRSEALGVAPPSQLIAEFTHELRQPLSILEACAYCLGLALPAGDLKLHGHVLEMLKQLDAASRILDEGAGNYASRRECASRAEPVPAVEPAEPSRAFTNAAMSLVT